MPSKTKSKKGSNFSTKSKKKGNTDFYMKCIHQNLKALQSDSLLSDVTFVVGGGKHTNSNNNGIGDGDGFYAGEEIHGIRALFAAHSPVFRSMLYGRMLESNPDNAVLIRDVSAPAFKYIRDSFYGLFDSDLADELSPLIVVDVLFAAQKYLVLPLQEKCLAFIKKIRNIEQWFSVLEAFEAAEFQSESQLFLQRIVNEEPIPSVIEYQCKKFIKHAKFSYLKRDTLRLLLASNNLAVDECCLWNSVLHWCAHNGKRLLNVKKITNSNSSSNSTSTSNSNEDDEKMNYNNTSNNENNSNNNKIQTIMAVAVAVEEEAKSDLGTNSTSEEEDEKEMKVLDISGDLNARLLLKQFVPLIRFSQMDMDFFMRYIKCSNLLCLEDVIYILANKIDAGKYGSRFNDQARLKSKPADVFQLKDVCLGYDEICRLRRGDRVDFRDYYGLYCSATVIDANHDSHAVKIHYDEWSSTYDEWFDYKVEVEETNEEEEERRRSSQFRIISQLDKCQRFARHQSVSAREVERNYFKENDIEMSSEVQVRLPGWFWSKNEAYIEHVQSLMGAWMNATIVSYRTGRKYSHHIKIGVDLSNEHFEYWVHPDNNDEIRPIARD